jgi:hypothetical protein
MGAPLPPLLPHATTTLPTSLPTRPLFRYTVLLRRIRFYHFLAPPQGPNSNRSDHLGTGCLELEPSVAIDLCFSMDEGTV